LGAGTTNDGALGGYRLIPGQDVHDTPDIAIDRAGYLGGELGRTLIPTCGNLDGDSADELLVALVRGHDQRIYLFDHELLTYATIGLPLAQVHGNGILWPILGSTQEGH